jgi:hypothetical protein
MTVYTIGYWLVQFFEERIKKAFFGCDVKSKKTFPNTFHHSIAPLLEVFVKRMIQSGHIVENF